MTKGFSGPIAFICKWTNQQLMLPATFSLFWTIQDRMNNHPEFREQTSKANSPTNLLLLFKLLNPKLFATFCFSWRNYWWLWLIVFPFLLLSPEHQVLLMGTPNCLISVSPTSLCYYSVTSLVKILRVHFKTRKGKSSDSHRKAWGHGVLMWGRGNYMWGKEGAVREC